jgi:hypothetical protein
MSKETLKLALEALENSVDLVREDAYNAEKLYGNYPTRQGKVRGLKVLADDHEKAITAIKQALAAPEQEFVCSTGLCHYKPAAQPTPVQERNFCERCGKRLGDLIHTCTPPAQIAPKEGATP